MCGSCVFVDGVAEVSLTLFYMLLFLVISRSSQR